MQNISAAPSVRNISNGKVAWRIINAKTFQLYQVDATFQMQKLLEGS